MDTVKILRDLWRRRLLVVGLCLLALLAGAALKSRQYEVGVATASILVDTPSSQVVEVAPRGSDTLGTQANLVASLMVDGAIKSAIAHRAGLQPNQLAGVTDALTASSAASASQASAPGPRAFVLTTQVPTDSSGDQLPVPIIQVHTQAPNQTGAARLAAAAIAGLGDYLNSKSALERVPDANRLQITGMGPPQATTEVRGPSDVIAIVAVILIFALGCACILGVVALIRGWRAASAREQLGDDGLLARKLRPAPEDPFFDDVPETPTPARPAARLAERPSDNGLAALPHPALVASPPEDDPAVRRGRRRTSRIQ